MSEVDRRERHLGVSHHVRAILDLCLGEVTIAWPRGLDAPEWLGRASRSTWRDGTNCARLPMSHMGRRLEDDPCFFMCAFAAGEVARDKARRLMEERRLGPVVGLGTWDTFGGDGELAREVLDALRAGTRSSTRRRCTARRSARSAALDDRRGLGHRRDEDLGATVAQGRAQYEDQRRCACAGRGAGAQPRAWREHLPWLEEEREGGRIERIGVTHYDPSAFRELAEACEQAVSRPSSCRTTRTSVSASRSCRSPRKLGIAVIVMRPLGKGRLLRREPDPRARAAP